MSQVRILPGELDKRGVGLYNGDMIETTLKKQVGFAEPGTPVVVVEETAHSPSLLRCVLNGRTRLLFRDEINLDDLEV